jgi:hypothetical protein
MSNYLLARLAESSTWRGLVMLITALGVKVEPAQMNAIIAAGMAAAGLIAVFMPDRKSPAPAEPPSP